MVSSRLAGDGVAAFDVPMGRAAALTPGQAFHEVMIGERTGQVHRRPLDVRSCRPARVSSLTNQGLAHGS